MSTTESIRFPSMEEIHAAYVALDPTPKEVLDNLGFNDDWHRKFRSGRIVTPSYTRVCAIIEFLETRGIVFKA